MIFAKLIFAVMFSLFYTLSYGLSSVTNVEFSAESEKQSLIIEFSAKTKYTVFSLINPDRLVIDLENIDKRSVRKIISRKNSISGVSRFRMGTPFPDTTRLVLDLNKNISQLHASERSARNGNEQVVVQWETPTLTVTADKPNLMSSSIADVTARVVPENKQSLHEAQANIETPDNNDAKSGVQMDYKTANSEYLKAAAQGKASAMYMLGVMYANGQGVPKDYPQAVFWYRKAAEQEDVLAQFSMGIMYDIGQGVAQDYQQAMFWYSKAAEHGNVKAQNNLGFMYSQGKGVTQNYVTAHMWFNISGVRGYEEGRKNRDFVEKLMTPTQIAAAQQEASEWMKAHL